MASYAASRPRLEPGRFVHMNLAWVNEECVQVIALDEVSQTFTAVVAQKHAASEPVRPVIWLARVPWQGNHQALYIVVEALPAPGSEVTLVI